MVTPISAEPLHSWDFCSGSVHMEAPRTYFDYYTNVTFFDDDGAKTEILFSVVIKAFCREEPGIFYTYMDGENWGYDAVLLYDRPTRETKDIRLEREPGNWNIYRDVSGKRYQRIDDSLIIL